jgi:hypothetical protein
MTRETKFLRFLLVVLLFVLVLGCAFLYGVSLESAQNWPELAHLRLPVYIAAVVGLVPMVAAIRSLFDFLGAVDDGAAFSARTVEILRRMRLLIGIFAGYLVLGLVGLWAATGLMHPTILFAWLVLEVAALFLFTMVALLERIFVVALELREDNELTV